MQVVSSDQGSTVIDTGSRIPRDISVHENKEVAPFISISGNAKCIPEHVDAASEGGKRRHGRPCKNSTILLRGYASESGVNEVSDCRQAGPVTRSKATSRGLQNAFQILSNEESNMDC